MSPKHFEFVGERLTIVFTNITLVSNLQSVFYSVMMAYVLLERAVEKIVRLESFMLEKFPI